jgi:hypothetical protein
MPEIVIARCQRVIIDIHSRFIYDDVGKEIHYTRWEDLKREHVRNNIYATEMFKNANKAERQKDFSV